LGVFFAKAHAATRPPAGAKKRVAADGIGMRFLQRSPRSMGIFRVQVNAKGPIAAFRAYCER
jgi:hypothetical protein